MVGKSLLEDKGSDSSVMDTALGNFIIDFNGEFLFSGSPWLKPNVSV